MQIKHQAFVNVKHPAPQQELPDYKSFHQKIYPGSPHDKSFYNLAEIYRNSIHNLLPKKVIRHAAIPTASPPILMTAYPLWRDKFLNAILK